MNMNREIKFRAWDKKNKNMMVVHSIKFGSGGTPWIIDGYHYAEDLILMQYIGLKDKNGEEIYEGDILKAADGFVGVVTYIDFRAQFVGKNIGTSFENEGFDTLYTKDGRFYSAEIIGNIYENPELLEVTE